MSLTATNQDNNVVDEKLDVLAIRSLINMSTCLNFQEQFSTHTALNRDYVHIY